MKSILTVKDLSLDTQLGKKEMSAVRGGQGNQANGTSQFNVMEALASNNIANGAVFAGSAPVIIQADTDVKQDAHNDSTSNNGKLFALFGF